MARFMDVHSGFVGVTADQLRETHQRDLARLARPAGGRGVLSIVRAIEGRGAARRPYPPGHVSSPVSWLSFPRIIDVPFETCVAALEDWQRTGQDGEQRIGQSLLRWPIERDRDCCTCRASRG